MLNAVGRGVLCIGAGLGLLGAPARALAETAYGVTATNHLVVFDTRTPGTTSAVPITGLQPAETLVGIDIHPESGLLFGVGSTGRLIRSIRRLASRRRR